MTASHRAAQTINKRLKTWIKGQQKLVVGIDGYAGAGKTTIADYLVNNNPDILVVHMDDFIEHWKKRKKLMDQAPDKSAVFEYQWYRYKALQNLITDFKRKSRGTMKIKTYDFEKNDFTTQSLDLSKKILLLDGIFLFHPRHAISRMWDKKIYLRVDFKKADRRRIAREKKRWGTQYVPDTHPDSYFIPFKTAYKRYIKQYKPELAADLVIDV